MADGSQAVFAYSAAELVTLKRYISLDRLAAYTAYARGDQWVAIRLYERNTQISEALYGVVQCLEVTLRNAIHDCLVRKLGRTDWYEVFPFEPSERRTIEGAKSEILRRSTSAIPGRIIAELVFGFWVKMFSNNYDKTLWVPYLHTLFPPAFNNERSSIYVRLKDLKTLKNRIAHHERITCGRRNPERDYSQIPEAIGWINPTVQEWIASTNCFQERFNKRLPKRPKA